MRPDKEVRELWMQIFSSHFEAGLLMDSKYPQDRTVLVTNSARVADNAVDEFNKRFHEEDVRVRYKSHA